MRIKKIATRIGIAATLAFASAMGVNLVGAEPAAALPNGVTCWGDYCSGQDPEATRCAIGSQTVASVRVRLYYDTVESQGLRDVGRLDLRWSPTCKTNWARLVTDQTTYIEKVGITQDTGYEQIKWTGGGWPDTAAGLFWTPMIYSPVKATRAWVGCRVGFGVNGCGTDNTTSWV